MSVAETHYLFATILGHTAILSGVFLVLTLLVFVRRLSPRFIASWNLLPLLSASLLLLFLEDAEFYDHVWFLYLEAALVIGALTGLVSTLGFLFSSTVREDPKIARAQEALARVRPRRLLLPLLGLYATCPVVLLIPLFIIAILSGATGIGGDSRVAQQGLRESAYFLAAGAIIFWLSRRSLRQLESEPQTENSPPASSSVPDVYYLGIPIGLTTGAALLLFLLRQLL